MKNLLKVFFLLFLMVFSFIGLLGTVRPYWNEKVISIQREGYQFAIQKIFEVAKKEGSVKITGQMGEVLNLKVERSPESQP